MTEDQMKKLDKNIRDLSIQEMRICLTEMVEAASQDNKHNPSRALNEARKWGMA